MNHPKIIDILGNELNPGDICAYQKNEQTGSCTVRKILHVGKITGISPKGVVTFENTTKVFAHNDIVKIGRDFD